MSVSISILKWIKMSLIKEIYFVFYFR